MFRFVCGNIEKYFFLISFRYFGGIQGFLVANIVSSHFMYNFSLWEGQGGGG